MTDPVLCGMKYIIKKIIDTERANNTEIQIGVSLRINYFKGYKVLPRNINDVLSWLMLNSKIFTVRVSKNLIINLKERSSNMSVVLPYSIIAKNRRKITLMKNEKD